MGVAGLLGPTTAVNFRDGSRLREFSQHVPAQPLGRAMWVVSGAGWLTDQLAFRLNSASKLSWGVRGQNCGKVGIDHTLGPNVDRLFRLS